MDIGIKDGGFLVKYARAEIKDHLTGEKLDVPEEYAELLSTKAGVFVRLSIHPKKNLRGISGYTEAIIPLKESIKEVAIAAAIRDRRFHPLRKSELKTTTIEVSILSEPRLLEAEDPEKYPERIEVGKDGVIVEKNGRKGIILPQMAVDSKWNPKQLLSHACMSASLMPDAWLEPESRIYTFNAEVFCEEEPEGRIVKRKLH